MALNSQQVKVARKIISEGNDLHAPRHVIRVALATWLTENPTLVHGGDRDSSGPFQQRPSQGWGPATDTVRTDARQFYEHAIPLFHQGVRGGALAQAVQRSAFPGRYQPHLGEAGSIIRGMGENPTAPAKVPAPQKVTATAAAAPARVQIPTISLPNPLPTALPMAGPTLPAGSIGSQSVSSPTRRAQQTPTGQSQASVPTAPAAAVAAVAPQQQPQAAPQKKHDRGIPLADKSVPAPRPVKGLQPGPVRTALSAAKEIAGRPYIWGGGHGGFQARGYDCSGAVSYVLHKLGVLSHPLTSGAMGSVLKPGPGEITVFYNAGHTFMRFQTPHGFVYWGTSVGDSGAGGLGKHPAPDPTYLSQYKVGHVTGIGGAEAVRAVAASTPTHGVHPEAATVKINKGIHTATPRFSSQPILADSTPAAPPQTDLLTKSQTPHVPLSVRRIGAGRKRPRIRVGLGSRLPTP